MNSSKIGAAWLLVAIVLSFAAGYFVAGPSQGGLVSFGGTASSTPIDLGQFWQAWNLLNENYVPTHASSTIPTDQAKLYGAIAGLTNSYGDPYTVFFPPQQAQTFQEDIAGAFGGVGMQMDVNKDGAIVVTAPLKGSPAEAAGVKAGDIVVSIDGTSTQGMEIDEAIHLIRGPVGTVVKLQMSRAGKIIPITITRQTINIPEINSYERSDGVYVIQLYTFSANSADLFRDALRKFYETGSNKLVFDLRGNPGGYLEAAVDMASYFLPVGQTVVTEDFKGKAENIVHRSLGYNVFAGKNLKMAILVDQGSASASEILSGALQQHGVAKLVGTRTFGKGSVQELMDLGGGAELKVTVARWLTPNGTNISDGGIAPDIKADRTQANVDAGVDPQMDAAVKYLNGQ